MNRLLTFTALALTGLLLTACGGDNAPAQVPAANNEVPASALASPQALVDWSTALATSETAEPLDVQKAMPPTSDTDEPSPVVH